jgi:3-dehydroquinate synthase
LVRIRALIHQAGLPVQAPNLGLANWLSLMSHDKKVSHGKMRFVLLQKLGQAVVEDKLPLDVLQAVLTGPHILDSDEVND